MLDHLHYAGHHRGYVDMPRCDGPRIDQHCKHGEHQASQALRNPQESLARIAVDGAARERREQQQRDELDAARQAELHHRIGELINEPAAGQLVHPRAEIAEQLAAGNQPEIAVSEGDECAMVAEGGEKRLHQPDFTGLAAAHRKLPARDDAAH